MDDGVERPHVAWLGGECAHANGFGLWVEVALLEAEGVHAEHEPEQRMVLVPGEQHAASPVAQADGVAAEEVELVADGQGEDVPRVLDGEGGEAFAGAVEVAGGVGAGGVDMLTFAVAHPRDVSDVVEDRARLGCVGRLRGEAAQVGAADVAEHETGIVRDRRLPGVADVIGEQQQRAHGRVVPVDTHRTRAGHLVAALVDSHRPLLSPLSLSTVRMATSSVVRGFPYRSKASRLSSKPCCMANSVAVDRVEAPILA